MGDHLQSSPTRQRRGVCLITAELISEVSGNSVSTLSRLQSLDLHLRDEKKGKIRKIENLIIVPNLKQLNLSYNAITKIEGLGRLHNLVELNLAENAIKVIENLDSLRALERLNLSGNLIERIPEDISVLQRLTSLRLARNQLDVQEDLVHLSKLQSLTNLRIDENPFSASASTFFLAIFCIPNLTTLDNVSVNEGDREDARQMFSRRPPAGLRSRSTSPAAARTPSGATGASAMKDASTPEARQPAVRMTTPSVTPLTYPRTPTTGASARAAATPAGEIAAQHITQLNERIETLTSKLIASDREKNSLRAQLDEERQRAGEAAESAEQKMRVAAKELEIVQQENDKIRREMLELRRVVEASDNLSTERTQAGAATGAMTSTAELERLRQENIQLHRDLERTKHEATIAADSRTFSAQENEQLRRTVMDLRKTLSERDASIGFSELASRQSSMDQWSAHESRVQIASQRNEIEALRQEVTKLHREVEQSMRETTVANEARLSAAQDAEQLRGKLGHAEEVSRAMKSRLAEVESEMRRLTNRLSEAESTRTAFEQECARLTASLAVQEAEMDAYFKAREATPRKVTFDAGSRYVVAEAEASRGATSSGGLFQSPTRGRARKPASGRAGEESYIPESASDDGSEDSGPIQPGHLGASASKPSRKSAFRADDNSVITNRPFYGAYTEPVTFSVTQLEIAAAEVVALVLMQEIDAHMPPEAAQAVPKSPSKKSQAHAHATPSKNAFLKEACIRAALRVIHSSTAMARQHLLEQKSEAPEGSGEAAEDAYSDAQGDVSRSSGEFEGMGESKRDDRNASVLSSRSRRSSPAGKRKQDAPIKGLGRVEIHPFHALGDREFLARVVAETHAGMSAIEDSDSVKEEIKQLQVIVRELEMKSLTLQSAVAGKQHSLAAIEKHCDDAKSKSEEALTELEFLTQRLLEKREAITRDDTEHNLLRRELELTRHSHQEELAMSEIEQNNLHAVRSRLVEVKHELTEAEQQLLICKESILKEENRLRATKATATDHLRLLQIELNKISSDFKVKQRLVEDLEKHRRIVDEEIEIRKRDSDLQLSAVSRELEDEARKLNNVKCEVRASKLEGEQLVSKRRQVEAELDRLQETFATESARCAAEEQEARRKLLQYEKQLQAADKTHRDMKSKIAGLEGEEVILRHSVEEMRRQQGDMERAAEVRRRTTEEELSQAQHQVQVAMRAARQADGEKETKRAELEAMALELRSMERRLDELKRQAREQEMLLDSRRDSVKALDIDRDRRFKDTATQRKEEEELRHQSQLLRASIDNFSRENEELKRRLAALKEEESSLKDSEMRMQSALTQSRKGVEGAQIELDELRASSERERRALADLRTKKSVAEAEMSRLEESLKFETERVGQESLHRAEVESEMARCHEDMIRSQRALASVEKRLEDAARREDELKRNEAALKSSMEKLRLEVESLGSVQTNEKATVATAREELREINLEIRRGKESLRAVQQEVQTGQLGLETLQAQRDHLESIKDELSAELNRIRESARAEFHRVEKLETTYSEADQRLKAVRADLIATEQTYEHMRNLTAEEEQRVQAQRRSLRHTLDELNKVERLVSEGHKQVYEERQRAMIEIGQLSQAKQSAQAHMFLTSEAQKRLDSRAALPSHGSSLSARGRADASPERLTSILNIPDYLHSTNTSTLYKATPSFATSGVKLNMPSAPSHAERADATAGASRPVRDIRSELLAAPTLRTAQEGAVAMTAAAPTLPAARPAYSLHPGAPPARSTAAESTISVSGLQREVERLREQTQDVLSKAGLSSQRN